MPDLTSQEHVALTFLEDQEQRLRFQHEYTLAGFKTLFLLQGGAIVALLTYAGHAADSGEARQYGTAFAWYVGGLVSTVLAYLAAYASQGSYAAHSSLEAVRLLGLQAKEKRSSESYAYRGDRFVIAAIALCVLSLGCFIAGSWCAFEALS